MVHVMTSVCIPLDVYFEDGSKDLCIFFLSFKGTLTDNSFARFAA